MNESREIYTISTLKGGSRKSTTAMFLAFAWTRGGNPRRVLVIDADTRTQGVTDWCSRMAGRGIAFPAGLVVRQWVPREGLLAAYVVELAEQARADRVLIDLGAEHPEAVEQALAISTRMVSPVGGDTAELGRLAATRALAVGAGVEQSVLLTRVPTPRAGRAAEARALLADQGYQVMRAETRRHAELYADPWGYVPADVGEYADVAAELDAMAVPA